MANMNLCQFIPPVIAHRGASAYAPENTMAAFTKAAQLGVKWIEFDVMLAACGEPIIFHDDYLERTTNGYGTPGEYAYNYLHGLDAGAWFNPIYSGERIPTLRQALDFFKHAKIDANIEIKPLPGQDKQTVTRVLQEINTYFPDLIDNFLFSSFSIPALEALRQYSPQLRLGLLMHEWLPDWPMISESINCSSINVNESILTPEKAKKIKNTGRSLLCYTVNSRERAEELFKWGVDAIFSDVPDIISK